MQTQILRQTPAILEVECILLKCKFYIRVQRKKYPNLATFFLHNRGLNILTENDLGNEIMHRIGRKSSVYSGIDCLNELNAKIYYIPHVIRRPKKWM